MGEKIKILHLVEAFGGGVFFFLSDLVNSTDKNYEITIAYGIRKETPDNFKEYFGDKVKFIEIKNFTRSINPIKDLKAMREIKKLVKEVNPDVVHMHSSKAGALGRLAIRAKKRKLLYNPHGFSFLKQDDSLLKRAIYKVLEKLLALKKCTIIGCSQGECEEARKLSKNSICISNGVNIPKLQSASEGLKSKKIDCNKLKICTCARITYPKNPKMFNDIAKAFPEIEFTWIGDGELREELTANNINITGWKEKKELLKIINENDIFILPSLWEGLPLALLEAMYMNKICIVSNCIGNRDVINNRKNGFVCNKLEDYINVINEIKNEYEGIENIQNQAKLDVENIYNTRVMAKQYDEIYKKRVLHIVNSNSYSGLEKVAIDIIKNLENEYDLYYVTQDGSIVERLEKENVKRIKLNKMSIREIRRICKEYKPDIIHAHDYTATIITAFSFVKVPIISHLHNNAPWIKKLNLYSIIMLIASMRIKKILTVSDAIRKEYIFSKYISKKIENISNPVSVEDIINKVPKQIEKKYDICFCGRLTKAKNPIKFISIISELKKDIPNIKSIMLGDGELRKECEEKIEKLNLQNNIKMIGFVENPYIYMAEAKIFCLTSDWEGYGLVAFEALALGLPAYVTPVGGLSDIVDEQCGKLCSENYDFVTSITKVLNDEKLYVLKRINAMEKSKQLENISQYIHKLKNIYINVV